jgi:tripartite-type tricarboxylate transporter receptor subunit TctC
MDATRRIPFLFALFLCVNASVWAQDAVRTVRLVIPFPPGAGSDLHARAMARHLSEALGQPVVVENRAGAGGTLAADTVAKAPPDGSQVLFGGSSVITVAPNVYTHLPYDPMKDLAPVTQLTREPFWILARTTLPANTVQELVALARSQPGKLNYASYGNGTLSHLAAELFISTTGIRMTHIPYKGQAPAMTDLMGGQVDVMLTTVSSSLMQVQAGKAKVLAVATPARLAVAPSSPTLKEAGVALEVVGWTGAFVSAGTPPAVIARLNTELTRINRLADIREGREALGTQAVTSTPQELGETVRKDLVIWAQAVKAAGGLKLD